MATQVTARRGASDHAPENTLAAIHQAVQSGADRIEVDVHASRDGRLVLHHFYALGATDDGEGLVFERDAAYLRASYSLDRGSRDVAPAPHDDVLPATGTARATGGCGKSSIAGIAMALPTLIAGGPKAAQEPSRCLCCRATCSG